MYEIFVKLLQQYNATPYSVSKATGISQATLSDWKLGKSIPKTDKMQKLSDYFGVTLEYLLGWDRPLDDMDKAVHNLYGWKPGDGPLPKNENAPTDKSAEAKKKFVDDLVMEFSELSEEDMLKVLEYVSLLRSKYKP